MAKHESLLDLQVQANSFTQLLQNLTPNDPMYDQGLELVNRVLGALKAKPLSFPEANADGLSKPIAQ